MAITGRENNDELSKMLPELRKAFEIFNSESFVDFENKLDKTLNKSICSLHEIIEDGTLAMDPEQLVKATDVLGKTKINLMDSKRKLLETLLKGEMMVKALEPPKKESGNSVLEDYFEKNKQIASDATVSSIFSDIAKSE